MSPLRQATEAAAARILAWRQLHAMGVRDQEAECVLDWAGPVAAPLVDETTVQAACGIAHVHGRRFGRPTLLNVDYATVVAGVLATQGVLAMLVARRRGLSLRRVETSVAQAALLSVSQYLAASTTADDWAEPLLPGGPPFVSADGARFELETFEAERWHRFWTVLAADPAAVRAGWRPFQHRYATATCPLPEPLFRAANGVSLGAIEAAADLAGVSVLRLSPAERSLADLPPWQLTPLGPADRSARPVARLAPLDGLVVIEAGRRLQGPLAGHLLRLLGATVIRVEPPGGDLLRGMPPMAGDTSARFRAINDGKQVVRLDLHSPAGRDGLLALAAGADVFLHNWAPGKAAQLRLDAEDLVRVKPGLVYAWASGWGAELGARPPLGTDFMVQAYSGLAAEVRPPREPATTSLMTLTDILGGLVCAQGVLAGLLARFREGRGRRVDSSLLSAAAVLRRLPRTPRREPLSTVDGWLAVSADPQHGPAAARAFELPHPPGYAQLVLRCARRPTAFWLDRLAALGVPATAVCTDLATLSGDPRFEQVLRQADGYLAPTAPWTFT
ncbi:CoA transferase [Crossiella sp. CA-258035]|uniref:CoA transferase n=1 Tax=Crossiella sp. CA-258035 TaxID=2981138 RepID=UPI0024BCFF2F|nr:CoA transferase [Crossiella sp. CA-258035]WHT22864.1 CoA transferase [Crossiella sp. CA-258035]